MRTEGLIFFFVWWIIPLGALYVRPRCVYRCWHEKHVMLRRAVVYIRKFYNRYATMYECTCIVPLRKAGYRRHGKSGVAYWTYFFFIRFIDNIFILDKYDSQNWREPLKELLTDSNRQKKSAGRNIGKNWYLKREHRGVFVNWGVKLPLWKRIKTKV